MATARQKHKSSSALYVQGKNRLLSAAEQGGHAVQGLQKVTLAKRTTLHERDTPVTHAYFPISGVGSVIATAAGCGALELDTVGNEGMVGLPLLLGAERSPTEAFVQVAGDFMRMTSEALKQQLEENRPFAEIARRYVLGFFLQAAQSAACRRYHQTEQRLSRWILESHDRAGEDRVPITNEFLGLMLGVQRPGVNLAAAQLQKAGCITYQPDVIEVLDREALEASACSCYSIVRKEFERLLC